MNPTGRNYLYTFPIGMDGMTFFSLHYAVHYGNGDKANGESLPFTYKTEH